VTPDTLVREAADIQQKAIDGGQYSVAIMAMKAKAKLAAVGRADRTKQYQLNYAAGVRP
jgi:hypothetical protein